MIIKSFYFSLVFIFLSLNSFGQVKTVNLLIDSTVLMKEDRIVVLLETDTFKVVTTYKRFIDNCKRWIAKHDVEWDKNLLELFLYNCSNPIYAQSMTTTKLHKSRLNYRISDLLEEGDCLVIYKPNKQIIKKVIIEKYITKYPSNKNIRTKENKVILDVVEGVF